MRSCVEPSCICRFWRSRFSYSPFFAAIRTNQIKSALR